MKKMLKKSDVLREGYVKGLKEAQRIINEMLDGGDSHIQYKGMGLAKDREELMDELYREWRSAMHEFRKTIVEPTYISRGYTGLKELVNNDAGLNVKYSRQGIRLVPTRKLADCSGFMSQFLDGVDTSEDNSRSKREFEVEKNWAELYDNDLFGNEFEYDQEELNSILRNLGIQ